MHASIWCCLHQECLKMALVSMALHWLSWLGTRQYLVQYAAVKGTSGLQWGHCKLTLILLAAKALF